EVLSHDDIADNFRIGITVKAETQMQAVEFYNQFPEVQLMTIETGKQGNPFMPAVLEKSQWLRSEGFTGMISIDGGVSLYTAETIKSYPIDRVSVGSFLSKSPN